MPVNGSMIPGRIVRIAGPVVGAKGLGQVRLFDVVRVGQAGLIGEVIRLKGDLATIQVYEDTAGIRIGEPVKNTTAPLSVRLGPGLLGQIYDGLQRPLPRLAELTGHFIERGLAAPPLPTDKCWYFKPSVEPGDMVGGLAVIGEIIETQSINHRIMIPADLAGTIDTIEEGEFTIDQMVASLRTEDGTRHAIHLAHTWPVRKARPVARRLNPNQPLLTGTRVIDALFPVAKGGSAIIPGGFGTGKTIAEHSLARWADVDVVVYVGCGERGNEMAEVLQEFPELEDPRTGTPLSERTVLIANTSNMPVAARVASMYTGVTIAEYYRDMGYSVLLLVDSTSRWGEALREISGRLEEIPGEEGYPAYLASRLAEFYERSGRVILSPDSRHQRSGSLTIVGAVSPPGADFSEPVTQNSMRVTGTFWALDYALSRQRHFPAINWNHSYSLYDFEDWYAAHVAADWHTQIKAVMTLLQREAELLEIVQLIGPDALSANEQLILFTARILREDFLQQSAFDPIDRFSPLEKTDHMLRAIMSFYVEARHKLETGESLAAIRSDPRVALFARMKELPPDDVNGHWAKLIDHDNGSSERSSERHQR